MSMCVGAVDLMPRFRVRDAVADRYPIAGALTYHFQRLPGEPIGNSTFTFSVKDEAGAPVVGFEYRLYVKDAADGIIGTVELDGAESYGASTKTFPYAYYTAPMTVELQIIKDGYEESLVEYVLHQTAQNVTVSLRTERNI